MRPMDGRDTPSRWLMGRMVGLWHPKGYRLSPAGKSI